MANNYLQFSEVLDHLTAPEEEWLKTQLQRISVFGDRECPEGDVPAELADKAADWAGERFLRDCPTHDAAWDSLGFTYAFDDDPDKGGWGRHLWIYDEECGNPDNAAWLAYNFLKKFRPNDCWALTWASTCSKPRVGEFGGGGAFVTADKIEYLNSGTFVAKQRQAFENRSAVYVSVWDDTIQCRSACKFDPVTRRVSDVELALNQEDAESCNALTDEYVEFGGKALREADGVVFEYKE